MKNIYKSILFPLAFTAILLFAGCSQNYEPLNYDDISNYRTPYVNECFQAFFNENNIDENHKLNEYDNIYINGYYGKFNNYAVLQLKYADELAEFHPSYYRKVYIGGVFLGNHHYIYDFYVYNESETDMAKTFMYLKDAYSEGIITKSHLKQIAYYIRNEK